MGPFCLFTCTRVAAHSYHNCLRSRPSTISWWFIVWCFLCFRKLKLLLALNPSSELGTRKVSCTSLEIRWQWYFQTSQCPVSIFQRFGQMRSHSKAAPGESYGVSEEVFPANGAVQMLVQFLVTTQLPRNGDRKASCVFIKPMRLSRKYVVNQFYMHGARSLTQYHPVWKVFKVKDDNNVNVQFTSTAFLFFSVRVAVTTTFLCPCIVLQLRYLYLAWFVYYLGQLQPSAGKNVFFI